MKRYFISLYITYLSAIAILGLCNLINGGDLFGALGLLVSSFAFLGFFTALYTMPIPRTSSFPFLPLSIGIVGWVFTWFVNGWHYAIFLSAIAILGWFVYTLWYAKLSSDRTTVLQEGSPLPQISLANLKGQQLSTEKLTNQPAVWLFYRGNWCPLCMAQIKELAKGYQQIEKSGAKVYLVSPQPEKEQASLAKKLKVPMQVLYDEGRKAASILGITHEGGTPLGMEVLGYSADTVLPTVIVTDQHGIIRWLSQPEDYRERPEPALFLKVLTSINDDGASY